MGTFNIWTIGCQMNTSDARKLSEELEEQGFSETEKARSADLVVLYSCMVRQHAEDKVRSKLGELRLLKREKPVHADRGGRLRRRRRRLAEEVPVRGLLPGAGPGHVAPRQAGRSGRDRPVLPRSSRRTLPALPRISEGITMHQGCNRNCTFCIVPSTRGRERSRTPDDILCEVQRPGGSAARARSCC